MLYLNHSCEPCIGVARNVVFVAMRDIAAGEELTIDYAMIDDSQSSMVCHCGTVGCRGTTSGQDWQLPALQQRYGRYFSGICRQKSARSPSCLHPWKPPPTAQSQNCRPPGSDSETGVLPTCPSSRRSMLIPELWNISSKRSRGSRAISSPGASSEIGRAHV
jgi:hypothetical protein